jgi:1-phosphofructokinase family hexose kinase
MIVCLSANPSIDKLFVVERVTPGAIHRPIDFIQVAGGKGLNVARAAAALGGEVRVVSLLAGHTGQWIAEALQSEGIAGRFSWMEGETRSCLSVADNSNREMTEFYEDGPEIDDGSWVHLRAVVEEALEGARWLVISGSLPRGAPSGGYAELIEAARRKDVWVALDARDRSLSEALPARPDVVKVNATEAGGLLGSRVTSLGDCLMAARRLRFLAGDAKAAIVTRGAEGAVAATPDASWRGRASVSGPYPVGSGDAFLAGLVVGLDRGEEWDRAFALAVGAGAANAEMQGAGRLCRERAEAVARQAEIVQLPHEADE